MLTKCSSFSTKTDDLSFGFVPISQDSPYNPNNFSFSIVN